MEIARLVLEYLQALAWPGITITAILIFRKQLRQLLANIGSAVHRVKKFTAPGTTIELINELSQKVELIDLTPSTDDVVPSPKIKSRFGQYATTETTTSGAPTTDTPTSEAPTPDAPTTDTPTSEAPTPDAPTTDTPTSEAPTPDAPTTDTPTSEAPTPDAPTTDTPTSEAPTPDAPTTDTPTSEAPTPDTRTRQASSRYIKLADTEMPAWIKNMDLDDLMRGTIIRIWTEIDASLFQLATVEAPWRSDYQARYVDVHNPMANIELLRARGIITEDSAESLIAARRIRNQVVHESNTLPLGVFNEYLRTISKLSEYLKDLCELI
ncbi:MULTISPECIES: hypothetical protein [unclassified Arthrobacter]|uniref:hypothetical protein n=1 Tax=unclassified Arthrobacter TaxID=235627 RepID=UPI0011B0A209|nr:MULTISPECIES: hypothetical protein [unclassified Arthrobacter]